MYFVTIRQKGSIPKEALEQIQAERSKLDDDKETDQLKLKRRILSLMERHLDVPDGKDCLLTRSPAPEILKEAIAHREKTGVWRVVEYVLMPNHIHLFFGVTRGSLPALIEDFKHVTARQVNKALMRTGYPLWQREWFDHWSRSAAQDEKIINYIRNNPVKAGLVKDYRDWRHGSWNQE